jgi:hypothetical protein
MTQGLVALRQSVEQLAAGQDQIAREIKQVLAADMEFLSKMPAPPPQPPAAPARKPGTGAAADVVTGTSYRTSRGKFATLGAAFVVWTAPKQGVSAVTLLKRRNACREFGDAVLLYFRRPLRVHGLCESNRP